MTSAGVSKNRSGQETRTNKSGRNEEQEKVFKEVSGKRDKLKELEKTMGDEVKTKQGEINMSNTIEDLKYWGLYYSELWNIVNARDNFGRKIWANLKPEEGDGWASGEYNLMSNLNIRKKHKDAINAPDIKIKHRNAMLALYQDPTYKLTREKVRVNLSDPTIYEFYHITGLIENCTRTKLIEKLSKMNSTEIKNFLLTIKGKTLTKLLEKYFTLDEYEDFTYNTKNNTKIGDYVENLTKELLQEDGYVLLYEGCNGNFIDMIYGVDLIMEKEGEIYLVQVKRRSYVAKQSTSNPKYRYIDIFSGESPDYNGIMLYNRHEKFTEKFMGKNVLKKNMDYLKELYK